MKRIGLLTWALGSCVFVAGCPDEKSNAPSKEPASVATGDQSGAPAEGGEKEEKEEEEEEGGW